jgi:hypothetical protein
LPDISSYGFEFSEAAINNSLTSDIRHADLTVPLTVEKNENTMGLCLEVLEHIPDENWRPVLENIAKLSDIILFSAAVPGQGGVGHIRPTNIKNGQLSVFLRFRTVQSQS